MEKTQNDLKSGDAETTAVERETRVGRGTIGRGRKRGLPIV